MTLTIDRLDRDDLADAVSLSTSVDWNQTRADWWRLLERFPDTCFAGRVDGELVATSTLAAYDDVAWIGMVLVGEAHRRRGYGSALFERALAAGRERARLVGLDATDAGRTVYARYGFEDVGRIDRWGGELEADPSAEPAAGPLARAPVDAADVLAFDRERTGVDRRRLLESLLAAEETTALASAPDGALRGYAVVRPGRTAPQVGPLVCADERAAEALLRAVSARASEVVVDAPRRDDTTALLERASLERRRELHRMVDGDALGERGLDDGVLDGDAVWAAAGFEWG